MQRSTKRAIVQLAKARLHALVALSILVLALLGRMPESQAGWLTCPPQVVMVAAAGWRRPRRGMGGGAGRPQTPTDPLAASDPHLLKIEKFSPRWWRP